MEQSQQLRRLDDKTSGKLIYPLSLPEIKFLESKYSHFHLQRLISGNLNKPTVSRDKISGKVNISTLPPEIIVLEKLTHSFSPSEIKFLEMSINRFSPQEIKLPNLYQLEIKLASSPGKLTHLRRSNSARLFSPSEKGSTLKEKSFLSMGANSFLL